MLSLIFLLMGCEAVEQWRQEPELVVKSSAADDQTDDQKKSSIQKRSKTKGKAQKIQHKDSKSPASKTYYSEPSESSTTIVKKSSFLRAITSKDIPVLEAEQVVREYQSELKGCAMGFKGKVRSELLVERGGLVSMVEIKADQAPHEVEDCLHKELLELTFNSPRSQRTKIHLSFRF
ncbi:MAG: hypothetical protein CMK59_07080 [Proteobacteria bacterium]|nr:hypothetical protein [Pseudomonadota bacterium]